MERDRQSRWLWIVVVAVVLAGAATVAIVGHLRERGRQPEMVEERVGGRVSEGVETKSMALFFAAADGESWIRETREIIAGGGVGAEARRVVEALARGPLLDGVPTLPPETTVENAFLDSEGRLYLNLGRELRAFHGGGTTGERLTIRSIVLTLGANFPDVTSVRFLEEGHPLETLAGHLDLSHPLWVDDWR